MFNKFIFLFFESLKSIGRSKLHSIVSSLAIGVSLIVLSLSYCLYAFLSDYKTDIDDIYEIEVYFEKNVCSKKIHNVHLEILQLEGIYSGQFSDIDVTKDILDTKHGQNTYKDNILIRNNALETLISSNIDNNDCIACSDIIDECECSEYQCEYEKLSSLKGCFWDSKESKCEFRSNPLMMYGSYAIDENHRDIEVINNLKNLIEEFEYINEVKCSIEDMEFMNNLVQSIFSFLFMIGIIISTVAVFYVSNTILLIIFSRNKDIEILKLLGASNNFIKFPYILEGIIIGIIGAVLSILILGFFYYMLIYFSDSESINIYNFNFLISFNFIVGAFLGFLGSSKALSSFMKK